MTKKEATRTLIDAMVERIMYVAGDYNGCIDCHVDEVVAIWELAQVGANKYYPNRVKNVYHILFCQGTEANTSVEEDIEKLYALKNEVKAFVAKNKIVTN